MHEEWLLQHFTYVLIVTQE